MWNRLYTRLEMTIIPKPTGGGRRALRTTVRYEVWEQRMGGAATVPPHTIFIRLIPNCLPLQSNTCNIQNINVSDKIESQNQLTG